MTYRPCAPDDTDSALIAVLPAPAMPPRPQKLRRPRRIRRRRGDPCGDGPVKVRNGSDEERGTP